MRTHILPDHGRDQVCVCLQLVPCLIPRCGEVHGHAVDEHVQLGERNRITAHRDREQSHHRVGAVAGPRLAKTAAMMLETVVARRATVEIGVVVDLTREVVQRVDGRALAARAAR